jgi:hypothetical protein
MMVVFRAIEHRDRTLESHRIVGIRQVLFAESLTDDGSLHDRAVKQCALQAEEPGVGKKRFVKRKDDPSVAGKVVSAVLGDRFPGDSSGVRVGEFVVGQQLGYHGWM